jgi:hypothetical protein
MGFSFAKKTQQIVNDDFRKYFLPCKIAMQAGVEPTISHVRKDRLI